MSSLDLNLVRKIHIVGIGGAGMSAIATVLVAMGIEVSGSDLKHSLALERLRALGVQIAIGHDPSNVQNPQAVARSSAVGDMNVEIVAARQRNIPVHSRADVLVGICSQRKVIAISGTHGKTTTSSMLALILVEAGLSPSFIIGGEVNEIGTNAKWGDGEWIVVEADESDGTFLELHPEHVLVTSVEADHLDYYGSFSELRAAFERFVASAISTATVCADDEGSMSLARENSETYGFSGSADWRIRGFRAARSEIVFDLVKDSCPVGEVVVPVSGAHNARNATGALAVALRLGVPFSSARRALSRFAGVARRFEFRGEINGVSFVDDYAHLPGEIAATLDAARAGGWRRIVCVFQPHRISRTASLSSAFKDSFGDADLVVITGIYAAGEAPRPGVSGKLIADAVACGHPSARLVYLPERSKLTDYLASELRPGDCCLTLGAGDLTSLADELMFTMSGTTEQ